jgi:hypothetical protein
MRHDTQHNDIPHNDNQNTGFIGDIQHVCHFDECHCAECQILFIVMLNVVKLSVLMLNVILVSVVAPLCTLNKLVNITFKITHNVI